MIKRETVVSLLAGFLVGACGIAPVVAGDGFGFGPAQGGGGGVTDAELIAIGALTPTDGNVIVGDGSTWVAESGATARASLGALGGSLGSTDNVLLRSDGTGGVTAQGSDATLSDAEVLDLTATGSLALGTGSNDPRLVRTATDTVSVQDGSANYGSLNAQTINLTDGANNRMIISNAVPYINMGSAVRVGWSSTSTSGALDTALSRDSAGRVLVENGSGTPADLLLDDLLLGAADATGFMLSSTATNNLQILDGDGTDLGTSDILNFGSSTGTPSLRSAPSSLTSVAYSFGGDPNTGMYWIGADNMGLAAGGAQIAAVGTLGVTRRLYPEAVTGNYTLADSQSDQVLTNTGAGGAVEIELGSITATGFAITVVATDNQDITLDPGASDKFVGLAGGWADGEAMLVDDQNDAVRLVRLSTGDWLVEWTRGTLTEETP